MKSISSNPQQNSAEHLLHIPAPSVAAGRTDQARPLSFLRGAPIARALKNLFEMKAVVDNKYHQEWSTTMVPAACSVTCRICCHLSSQTWAQSGINIQNQAENQSSLLCEQRTQPEPRLLQTKDKINKLMMYLSYLSRHYCKTLRTAVMRYARNGREDFKGAKNFIGKHWFPFPT